MGASSGCCFAGRLESGMIQTSDKLLLMPLNEVIQVKSNSYLKFFNKGKLSLCELFLFFRKILPSMTFLLDRVLPVIRWF